jgi:hypothetical protein
VIGDRQDGFRRNAVAAQRVFNGRFIDADKDPSTGVDGKERCLIALEPGDQIEWNDPCDTLETITDTWRSTTQCLWVDADCNPCTGIKGEETHIEFVGTTAPPPPNLNTNPELDPLVNPELSAFVDPAGDRQVILQWDNASELRKDPITGQDLFEGYRIWRVDNWQRPEGSIGPAPEEWMLIAEFRKNPKDNTECAACSRHHISRVQHDVPLLRKTDDGKDVYPIGRYEYLDRDGLLNGKVHFYAVTAFGITSIKNPVTGEDEEIELAGQPAAVEAEVVIPRWAAQDGVDCDAITVVPNPYRGGAEWDLVPSERDPTGTKIAFTHLPNEVATLRIYTMSGDLVQSATHDGRSGDGTYFWNLITRNGQNVVSGAYLYSVEYPGGVCRGRFVVIR